MKYEFAGDAVYLQGGIGDFFKNLLPNIKSGMQDVQSIVGMVPPKAAPVSLPPPAPAISPLMIGGIAAGGLALFLLLKKGH